MGLSRLSNFLKSVKGNIIYVDPNSLDSTDSTENQGNSLTRPFKTLQRALVEASRFSYQRGFNNDRFLKTTILLYPGEHLVDNRPGWIPYDTNTYKLRNGLTINSILEWDYTANFDVTDPTNDLYKVNSIHGGVIIPRGTSIVGLDLRKTKIRPLYVPNPLNDDIERSAIFRLTGGCYLWQFTILDADPNGLCYKDYTSNQFVPNFSHHKLTVFEYADGVNPVNIKDQFIEQGYSTSRTDLDMYYEKVGLIYGPSDSRPILNDFPSPNLDIQPVVDEYRIVGSKGLEVGINSIRSGNGVNSGSNIITVYLDNPVPELSVDTPIEVANIPAPGYNGQYVVQEVLDSKTIKYQVSSIPDDINPLPEAGTLSITVDTVSSASPYVFNCSLRSVYGMCGLHADGSKSVGFKSMVVAQFTGIGLQKDDNAFVRYNSDSGLYENSKIVPNLHRDSLAKFKPEFENYHIKSSNNAFLQLVSVFAIGYANHFLCESGGDHSITNSNSNFGAKSLIAKGFRDSAFLRDDCGYITHVVTPKEIESEERSIEYLAIDVNKTLTVGRSQNLYLYNETDVNNPPEYNIQGFRVGANYNDRIYVQLVDNQVVQTYSAKILMHDTALSSKITAEKSYRVGRSAVGINTIAGNIITFLTNRDLQRGESIRVISDNGALPDGLDHNRLYYAITDNVDIDQIKIAKSYDDAYNANSININNSGGSLTVVSRVSDKKPGDPGHPIQWESGVKQWYLTVDPVDNTIYQKILDLSQSNQIGASTPRTFIKRKSDNRNNDDKIYKVRYVLPKDNPITSRPPLNGYILQESGNTTGATDAEIAKYFGNVPSLSYSSEIRNFKFVSNATWDSISNSANVYTELPHDLTLGSEVKLVSIASTNNTTAKDNLGFNGSFVITGIDSSRHFKYSLSLDPGEFSNDTNNRTTSLPRVSRKRYPTTYQVYRSKEIQKYEQGKKDGVYHLTLINSSNNPSVYPYSDLSFSQPIQNLYPQVNRDNTNSDPDSGFSYALPNPIGQVVINEPQRSITKETVGKIVSDLNVGFGITNLTSSSGISHTIFTRIDHGLNGITNLDITDPGDFYSDGTYYNVQLVGFGNSITGKNATAVVTVTLGKIANVRIMDGGSAYGIGNTLALSGLTNTLLTVPGYVTVNSINDAAGQVIKISGISSHVGTEEYNQFYTISNVKTGEDRQFSANSIVSIKGPQVGLGSEATLKANYTILGKEIYVNSFTYDSSTGYASVGFNTSHGFRQGSQVKFYNSNDDFLNKSVFVDRVNSNTSIRADFGITQSNPVLSGLVKATSTGYSSNAGDIENDTEYKSARLNCEYDKITSYLSSSIFSGSPDTTLLNVKDAVNIGLKFGDYLLIDDEIIRINSNVNSDLFSIIRGILGTNRQTHTAGTVVRKIKVRPVEFRRHSIIRASGHTFEYLGFGPGNYSTSLPERQDRILTPEEDVLAQATRVDGGAIIYTGMNSNGDFYNGNKKLTSTGEDQLFDAPIPTVTGEEPSELNSTGGYNLITPSEAIISRSLRVDGGEESNLISEFSGPAIFNNKITAKNSVEVYDLKIKGDLEIPRQIGISTIIPSLAGNVGDIVLNSSPQSNKNVGWVYTNENNWRQWGWINDKLYGIYVKGNSGTNLSQTLNVVGSGVNVDTSYDNNTGISTVTIAIQGANANQVGFLTGPSGSQNTYVNTYDLTNVLKFVGSSVGFGFNIYAQSSLDPLRSNLGITTVVFESPIRPLNFGVANFGNNDSPSTATTCSGTRVIYENSFSVGSADNYATGVSQNKLWNAIPQANSTYSFAWYAGGVGVATITGTGNLQISNQISASGNITGKQLISNVAQGTAPISIASSTAVSNLTAKYLAAEGSGVPSYGIVATASSVPNTIVVRDSNYKIEGSATRLITKSGVGETGGYYEDITARLGYTPFNKSKGDVVSGISTFYQVSDVWQQYSPAGTIVTFDFKNGPLGYINGALTAGTTIIIQNFPAAPNTAYNYSIVVNSNGNPTSLPSPSTLTIYNGDTTTTPIACSIKWLNGPQYTSTDTLSASTYLIGLTFFYGTPNNPNGYEVLGVFGSYS